MGEVDSEKRFFITPEVSSWMVPSIATSRSGEHVQIVAPNGEEQSLFYFPAKNFI